MNKTKFWVILYENDDRQTLLIKTMEISKGTREPVIALLFQPLDSGERGLAQVWVPSFSLLQWWDADDMSYLPTSNEGQVTMTPSPQIQIHDLSPSPILPWVSSINVPKNHCRVNSLVSPSPSPTVFWNHSDLALTWRDPSAHWSHMDLVESHKS